MAGVGGFKKRIGGEGRFYCPPALRKQKQQLMINKDMSNNSCIEDSSDDPTTSFSFNNSTNIDRFLEHTTPTVISQQFPKRWKTNDQYFSLAHLWEALGEWSAYGVGVPLVLNGNNSIIQYYVPYLSAIQLYIHSSDQKNNLIFEYMEQETPYTRKPLVDQISILETRFPEIKTLRSCDLTHASWISVAWYPIYRIPIGPTLQNLDACFLTYHSLSTPLPSTRNDWPHNKVSLQLIGLASYKFKVSDWTTDGVEERQKVESLLSSAENWLRGLEVNHHDYSFFVSRNLYWR